jgi:hypothetical protein
MDLLAWEKTAHKHYIRILERRRLRKRALWTASSAARRVIFRLSFSGSFPNLKRTLTTLFTQLPPVFCLPARERVKICDE